MIFSQAEPDNHQKLLAVLRMCVIHVIVLHTSVYLNFAAQPSDAVHVCETW